MTKIRQAICLPLIVVTSLVAPLGFIATTSSVQNINESKNQTINMEYAIDWSKHLQNVPLIPQETGDYCVPAVIQMLFAHFDVPLGDFSQDVIYQTLGGNNGIEVNDHMAAYITDVLFLHSPDTVMEYELHELNTGYGQTASDMLMFESYITYSLNREAPVLFHYATDRESHIVEITGIDVSRDNMAETMYTVNDPSPTGHGGVRTFYANDLQVMLSAYGGALVGPSKNFDFKSNEITVSNTASRHYENWSGQYDDSFFTYPSINLTSEAGITTLNRLKRMDEILFKNFSITVDWGKNSGYEKTLSIEKMSPTQIDWNMDHYEKDANKSWDWWSDVSGAWFTYFWKTNVDRDVHKNFFWNASFEIFSGHNIVSATSIHYNAFWGDSIIIVV